MFQPWPALTKYGLAGELPRCSTIMSNVPPSGGTSKDVLDRSNLHPAISFTSSNILISLSISNPLDDATSVRFAIVPAQVLDGICSTRFTVS